MDCVCVYISILSRFVRFLADASILIFPSSYFNWCMQLITFASSAANCSYPSCFRSIISDRSHPAICKRCLESACISPSGPANVIPMLIMGRRPSWVSLSTHLPKSPPLLLSPTTAFSQPIHSLSTLMLLFCLTMRLSMTSAGAHLTLSVPHTPTLTVWSLRWLSDFPIWHFYVDDD